MVAIHFVLFDEAARRTFQEVHDRLVRPGQAT